MTIPGDVKYSSTGTGSVAELLGWKTKESRRYDLPTTYSPENRTASVADMAAALDSPTTAESQGGFANALNSPAPAVATALPIQPTTTEVPGSGEEQYNDIVNDDEEQ